MSLLETFAVVCMKKITITNVLENVYGIIIAESRSNTKLERNNKLRDGKVRKPYPKTLAK